MRNFLLALRVVFLAFSGVQKGKNAAPPQLRPIHYVTAGIFGVLCLIALLVVVVNVVV